MPKKEQSLEEMLKGLKPLPSQQPPESPKKKKNKLLWAGFAAFASAAVLAYAAIAAITYFRAPEKQVPESLAVVMAEPSPTPTYTPKPTFISSPTKRVYEVPVVAIDLPVPRVISEIKETTSQKNVVSAKNISLNGTFKAEYNRRTDRNIDDICQPKREYHLFDDFFLEIRQKTETLDQYITRSQNDFVSQQCFTDEVYFSVLKKDNTSRRSSTLGRSWHITADDYLRGKQFGSNVVHPANGEPIVISFSHQNKNYYVNIYMSASTSELVRSNGRKFCDYYEFLNVKVEVSTI